MRLKLILIGLLSFLCGSFVNVSAQEDYDVYLLVGQSNMAGRGYMLEGDDEPFDENVFMLDDQGKVIPATNPLNQYSTIRKGMDIQRICPGYGFARKISAETGRRILLVVNARGGTTMDQWAKGESGEGYYEEAVRRTKQAQQYGQLKAILWHQGCGDSRNTDTYMGKLSAFVSNLRTDLDAQEVPFIAGELGQWRPIVAAFNEMIHTIADHIPCSDWVSSDGCQPIVTLRSNGQPDLKDPHFDRMSQILIGERYAEKVLDFYHANEKVYVFNDGLLDDEELAQKAEAGIKFTLTHADSTGRLPHATLKKASMWPMAVFWHGKVPGDPSFKCWSFEPDGDWNYAVDLTSEVKLEYADGVVRIPVRKIEWNLEQQRYTPRVPSPENVKVLSDEIEYIDLVPYGGTQLCLTVFPVIKSTLKK